MTESDGDFGDLIYDDPERLRAYTARKSREKIPSGAATLFDDIHAFLGRFVAYPSEHAQVAHTLWIVHTHLMDEWESTPRIAFLSPEPGSGKTRALEVSALLVPNPVEAVNVTPAYLFRKVGDKDGRPTILYDEIDTVFGPRAKENEEIRGLINAGHRRGANAGRCVVRGKEIITEEIPAYCAVALAGLGGLPDTILSRCVIIRMRRRAPSERVEPYRHSVHSPEGYALRDRIARWALNVSRSGLLERAPDLPPEITDRNADVWESLIAIADAVGGVWPERARVAAVALVMLAREASPSLGVRLLSDLRKIFGQEEAKFTTTLLQALIDLPESPWADLKGKPLNDRGLSKRLEPYGIHPKNVRIGDTVLRGYARADMHDAWARYLQPPEALQALQALHPQHRA